MTRNEAKQSKLLLVTMEELIPQDHFLRKLDAAISFEFVYDIVAPLYSDRGRPSIDPVLLVKMLLLGYLYGIDSERKLAEEVRYNIAYRLRAVQDGLRCDKMRGTTERLPLFFCSQPYKTVSFPAQNVSQIHGTPFAPPL